MFEFFYFLFRLIWQTLSNLSFSYHPIKIMEIGCRFTKRLILKSDYFPH